jgi:fused signal recognition particle receptor
MFNISLKKKITRIFGYRKNREEIFADLEELLILSDISAERSDRILSRVRKTAGAGFEKDEFLSVLKEELLAIFSVAGDSGNNGSSCLVHLPDEKNVIMMVGVNGSGKTTTAAKLAVYFRNRGKKVLLCAADTFRAAGGSQLSLWGERLGIPVVGGDRGADPGSVVYNSLNSLKNRDYNLLIVDTAGRVQTKDNLMKELEKIIKIISGFFPSQPVEIFLVVDATMGQNTLDQARKFKEFSEISGIILAKTDGSAKGGTVINIVDEMKIPVKFIGTGEKETDLAEFSQKAFIGSLLEEE